MKRLLLNILPLLLIVGCSKEPINYETKLIQRDRVFYIRDTNKPYSGQVFSLHQNGQKKVEGTMKDGIPDGLYTIWYKNGNKKEKGTWKVGKYKLIIEWNEDGSSK